MRVIETPVFTRQLVAQLPDESYRSLQNALLDRPDLGRIIPGSGGLRKARWNTPGHGKRGGIRVIYYWAARYDTILLLFIYPKNVHANLSIRQIRELRSIVDSEYS